MVMPSIQRHVFNCVSQDVVTLRGYNSDHVALLVSGAHKAGLWAEQFTVIDAQDFEQIVTASARRRTIRTSATALDCAKQEEGFSLDGNPGLR